MDKQKSKEIVDTNNMTETENNMEGQQRTRKRIDRGQHGGLTEDNMEGQQRTG